MITLKLDSGLEKAINLTAKSLEVTKSELIQSSVEVYLSKLCIPKGIRKENNDTGSFSGQPTNSLSNR